MIRYIIVVLLLLSACDENGNPLPIPMEPMPTPTVFPTPSECPNPIIGTVLIGDGNNGVYKPVAEGGETRHVGNPVFLAPVEFSGQFDWCRVKTGPNQWRNLTRVDYAEWTFEPFSCFANGNRQHWRFDIPCEDAFEVTIVCGDRCQETVFTLINQDKKKVCERHD